MEVMRLPAICLAVLLALPAVAAEIKPAVLLSDTLEQAFDIGVGRMIAAHGDSLPAAVGHGVGRLLDRARQTFCGSASLAAAGDVDSRPRLAERQGNSFAQAATGAGDDCYFAAQRRHGRHKSMFEIRAF